MSERYAVILKETGEVSDIKLMEGGPPDILTDPDLYEVVKIDDSVKIGMVRGGKVGAVGGFGFPDELAAANRSETGHTRFKDTEEGKKRIAELRASKDAKATEAAPAPATDFDAMTVEELRDHARDNDISLHGASTKAEIIKEIKKAERQAA